MNKLLPILLACVIGAAAAVSGTPSQQPQPGRWYRGNTHAHTINSDGDSTADEVVRWYRENGYQFLVLTDHNFLTSVDGLNALHGADEQFLVIRGEEVTDRAQNKPLHINALNISRLVQPQGGTTIPEVLQRNVDAIREAAGVPHINHPNFDWAITADDLRQIRNDRLLEIFNGHPLVNNTGGGGSPGMEEIWDTVLSGGKLIYGLATDDAHHFKRPWDPLAAKPGQGWVMVRTDRLEPASILSALERGDFYSSTGVELEDYSATDRVLRIKVKQGLMAKYRIQWIGRGGRLLKETATAESEYAVQGNEGYVRARVLESNGRMAWTQPKVF